MNGLKGMKIAYVINLEFPFLGILAAKAGGKTDVDI
jgi:hypothetical protein